MDPCTHGLKRAAKIPPPQPIVQSSDTRAGVCHPSQKQSHENVKRDSRQVFKEGFPWKYSEIGSSK